MALLFQILLWDSFFLESNNNFLVQNIWGKIVFILLIFLLSYNLYIYIYCKLKCGNSKFWLGKYYFFIITVNQSRFVNKCKRQRVQSSEIKKRLFYFVRENWRRGRTGGREEGISTRKLSNYVTENPFIKINDLPD